ncbi:MAG: glycoside hydrolase family 5 protein [Hellea sp.]|nr:glycoside hydrolase family 5 protein [Hellea sp.]
MGRAFTYAIIGVPLMGLVLVLGQFAMKSSNQSAEASDLQTTVATNDYLTTTATTNSPVKRCMNMGGALEADAEGDWGYKIRLADFTRIKRAGFDTVRIPIKFSAHTATNAPYHISPDFNRRVDEIVDWAIVEGLQIIIDVHHYDELMRNPDAHEKRLEAIWTQLSYHYAKAPPSLMFELINEPNGKMSVARTDDLNRRLLSIIRKHNPQRWAIVGSAEWGSLDALLESSPPRDARVMTTFHYYDPFEFTHQGASWMPVNYPTGVSWRGLSGQKAAIDRDMNEAAVWRDQTGMPMLLGEFGAIDGAPQDSRARYAEYVRLAAERRKIGWCYWEWGTGFAAYDLTTERWRPGMKRALTGR